MKKMLAFVLVCLFPGICLSVRADVKAPTIDEIISAFRDADARTATMELAIDEYLQVKNPDGDLAAEGVDTKIELFRGKNVICYETVNAKSGKICRACYDGKESRVLFSNPAENRSEAYLRSDPPNRAGTQNMQPALVPFLLNIWDEDMPWHFDGDEFTVASDPVTVEGTSCYVLTGKVKRFKPELRYTLYLDPTIGLMPRKTELLNQDGSVKSTRYFLGYEEVEKGLWFPKRMNVFSKSGTNVYVVSVLNVNKLIADDALTVLFPDGTKVVDERVK